jgi:HEAT repeat protein/class 3 adenylate cyclase
LFKKKRIRTLIERYGEVESQKEELQILLELKQAETYSIQFVIEAFQKRQLLPAKAKVLLENLCDNSSVNDIVALIGDSNDEVRRVAKELIVSKWRKPSIPLLIDQLVGSSFHLSINATELLSIFKDPSCVTKLISMFNGADVSGRINIIKIVTKIGCDKSKKLIMSALYDESTDVCMASVKSLGIMKAPESVSLLIEKIYESDFRMKKLAMDSLIGIGDKRAAPSMVELLKDKEMIIRQKATEFLIDFAGSDIVPGIIDLLSSEDVNVRRCVVEVLNNMKDPETCNSLMIALKDSDWWVRQIATQSLVSIKGDNVVKGFRELLKDPDENIRRCAVEFFNEVPNETSFDYLIELLEDKDWWIREKTVTALGKLKDKRAIIPIAGMINDEDIKTAIPTALADIGGPEAINPLKEFLLDSSIRVRVETIKALNKLKTPETISDIKECLKDPAKEVRAEAVHALKALTGKTYKAKETQTLQSKTNVSVSRVVAKESDILTEAIVVIDLCNSTNIASTYGDNYSLNLMKALTKAVDSVGKKERFQFSKGTGDGFLLTFPKVSNSIRFAFGLLRIINNHNKKNKESTQINIRIAINFGETRVNGTGDRLGTAVNITFRVEGANSKDLIPADNGMAKEEMPLENYIFVTETVEKQTQNTKGLISKLVGLFELKGITGLHRIYQISERAVP